jgi:hypothetical protein
MRGFLRRVGKGAKRAFTPVFDGLWHRAHHQRIGVGTALRAFAHPTLAALALTLASAAASQPRPSIFELHLGTPAGELPEEEFVDPACGTNGGPPGLRLDGFEAFARCRPEASGLREVWFRYDDELEYIARAARDPDAVEHNNAMLMLGQPVILSLLVDPAGLVQGFRIFTDPHAE